MHKAWIVHLAVSPDLQQVRGMSLFLHALVDGLACLTLRLMQRDGNNFACKLGHCAVELHGLPCHHENLKQVAVLDLS